MPVNVCRTDCIFIQLSKPHGLSTPSTVLSPRREQAMFCYIPSHTCRLHVGTLPHLPCLQRNPHFLPGQVVLLVFSSPRSWLAPSHYVKKLWHGDSDVDSGLRNTWDLALSPAGWLSKSLSFWTLGSRSFMLYWLAWHKFIHLLDFPVWAWLSPNTCVLADMVAPSWEGKLPSYTCKSRMDAHGLYEARSACFRWHFLLICHESNSEFASS